MRSTLRLRLMVMILLVLLPAAVIITYDVFEARNHQVEDAEQQGRQLAQIVTASLDRVISHVEGTLDLLTQVSQVRRLANPECSQLMAEIVASQKRFATLVATDPSGTIGCASTPKAMGISTADRPWFQQVMKTQAFTVADYTIGRVSGKPVLGFALPIHGPGDGLAGVAYASVDLGWFGANDIGKSLPDYATFTLIDQTGMVMARHPDGDAWNAKSVTDSQLFAALKRLSGRPDRQQIADAVRAVEEQNGDSMGAVQDQVQSDLRNVPTTHFEKLEAAAVVSFDGLAMASKLPAGMDEDRVAAMSAALETVPVPE